MNDKSARPDASRGHFQRSLGLRLVFATLGFCAFFTLITVSVRSWVEWGDHVKLMNQDLALIEQVYQRTLSKAIWEMDQESLEAHLESAIQVESVGRVVLKQIAAQGDPIVMTRIRTGWKPSRFAPTRQLTLTYEPFVGAREDIGELILYGDENILFTEMKKEIFNISVLQVIQCLLIASLILLLFNRSVTVHVSRIARHLARLTPENLREPLQLDRPAQRDDELSALEQGINQLQDNLSGYLDRQYSYEQELAAHRDRLAERVRERTAELESLSVAQQVVLSLSHRLIHAPYEKLDAFQQSCLAEVAQRLGARHALWYQRTSNNLCFELFMQWRCAEVNAPPRQLEGVRLVHLDVALDAGAPVIANSWKALTELLTPYGAKPFLILQAEAIAFVPVGRGEEDLGFLVFTKASAVEAWRADECALMAMTAQMLLHSARHKAQLNDILQSQQALRLANAQLEELSRSDSLTGLPNRRHFDEVKEIELRRAQRSGQPLSVLLCDVDFFKRYNDTYGHAVGDQCLRQVAQTMRASIARAGDVVARIGGEEFAVILPATDAAAALSLAERLRLAVIDQAIPHTASSVAEHITLSIGQATLEPGETATFEALLELADRALYQAKAAGRNQIVSYTLKEFS